MRQEDAKFAGRWFTIYFWLIIPRVIISFLNSARVGEYFPLANRIGYGLEIVVLIIGALILYKMVRLDERYKKACFLSLASIVVTSVFDMFSFEGLVLSLVSLIPASILGLVASYYELHAHASVLLLVNKKLSDNWLSLWRWTVISIVAVIGSAVVAVLISILGAIGILISTLLAAGVSLWNLVILYNSAKALRDYEEPEEGAVV